PEEADDEGYNQEYKEQEEEYLGDACRCSSDAAESEYACHKRNDEEDKSVIQHIQYSFKTADGQIWRTIRQTARNVYDILAVWLCCIWCYTVCRAFFSRLVSMFNGTYSWFRASM